MTPSGASRRFLLVGSVLVVAGLLAALWFLFLQDDSITEAEATYDGSELTVELPDGASITVPPGAARPGSRVRARVVRPEEAPDLPAYARAILASWDFDVEGGILAPVTIRLPTSLAGESWVLALYRDNQWVPTGFDIVGGEIVAVVDHLTLVTFLQHACAIGAQLVFDTHCLGMLIDGASAALDAYDSILQPDHCNSPDPNIIVSNGHANGMIHGCTLLPSSAPEEREDPRLIVQNLRKFVLDIHVTSGSAEAIIYTYLIPSCCGGVTIVDGGSSFWLPDTRASMVHITGELSFNAVIGQVAYFTLLFIPGIDSVTKHPELVATVYHTIMEYQAIQGAQAVFQGDRSGGFEALIPVLRDAAFLKDLAGHIADRVGDKPHLLTRLGVQLPREILDEVFKIIDVVEVAITLRDLEKALIETDRLAGVAQFHLGGLPDGWMATLLPPPTPAASPPVTVQEPPRPAVFLQGPPSSLEPVISPEELATADGLWTTDDAVPIATRTPAVTLPPTVTAMPNSTPVPTATEAPTTTPRPTPAAVPSRTPVPTTPPIDSAGAEDGGSVAPDRAALVAFYNATGGASWTASTNWLSDKPVGEWYGVTTNSDGRVAELSLQTNGLAGTLPAALGELTNLKTLDLWRNRLTGPIPAELSNLANLEVLNIAYNQLTGPIPAWLGDLTNLRTLSLGGTPFHREVTGPIPAELGNLTNLEVLNIEWAQLTGPIPAELGELTNLRRLNLSLNELTGAIPAELGNLTNLERLRLSGNELTGSLPAELGNLTNLKWLALSNYLLTVGPIPAWLGDLTNLEVLYLSRAQLTGPIPAELGNLTNLRMLGLNNNELTGPIPAELGNLTRLESLGLDNNQLTGPIPAELGNLTLLISLGLRDNELTGPIPAELGNLTSVRVLALQNNRLTGPIPAELGNLTDLSLLWLQNNQLTGPIPAELGDLSLDTLDLQNNQLMGPIPAELGNLTSLETLDLQNNQLTGPIPAKLGDLTHLVELWLDGNQLTGPIPAELGDLTRLQMLRLDGNQLTGPIPVELGDLFSLGWLSLSGNRLTGCVPVGLRDVRSNDLGDLNLPDCG